MSWPHELTGALQDMAFPGPQLTFPFASLCEDCSSTVVVHTHRGGHGCFYEGTSAESWCFRLAHEWIAAAAGHQKVHSESPE